MILAPNRQSNQTGHLHTQHGVHETDHPPFAGKHALIIEDNDLNAEVLSTLLNQYGLTVTVMPVPHNLTGMLRQIEQLDAIFLDIELPGYDGFDVLEEIHALPEMGNIPVVAYTVHVSEIDRARRAGFHSFLGKPIKQELFGQQLERILNNQPVWDA